MSGPVLGLLCAWLAIITIVVVLTVRQVSMLTARELSQAKGATSVALDGPAIDSAVPQSLAEVLTASTTEVIFVSSSCSGCRDLMTSLSTAELESNVIILLSGQGDTADALNEMVSSSTVVLRDPISSALAHDLNIQSTPFGFTVQDGKIVRKGFIAAPSAYVGHLARGSLSGPETVNAGGTSNQ